MMGFQTLANKEKGKLLPKSMRKADIDDGRIDKEAETIYGRKNNAPSYIAFYTKDKKDFPIRHYTLGNRPVPEQEDEFRHYDNMTYANAIEAAQEQHKKKFLGIF